MKLTLTLLALLLAQVGLMYLYTEFSLSFLQLLLLSIATGGILGFVIP